MTKLILLTPLGVVAALVVLCLAPFALVYFLFDRFCSTIEEFRPRTNSRRAKSKRGQSGAAMLGKLLDNLPKNAPNTDKAGG